MRIDGKTFVVTGGGNGIGRQLVLILLSSGARVAAVDLSETGLAETKGLSGEASDRLSLHVADITDRARVAALPGEVAGAHPSVDGLVNCAGIIQPFRKTRDISEDAARKIMEINFFAPLSLIRAFEPLLLRRKEACVVNVSSMGGLLPFLGQALYGASKAAIKLLTENLHYEYAGTGIRVCIVFPGGVGTDIMGNSGVGMNPTVKKLQRNLTLTTPNQAARKIANAIKRNRYRVFIGPDVKLLYSLYKLSPRIVPGILYAVLKRVFPEWK